MASESSEAALAAAWSTTSISRLSEETPRTFAITADFDIMHT